MTNKITIEHNSQPVLDILHQLMDRLGDLSEPMQEVAATLLDSTHQAFADEADPVTGEPWQALSDLYLKRNPQRVGGDKLRNNNTLYTTIISDYGADWAQVGTNLQEYAAIHHFGGTPEMAPGPRGIPARPFLGLSPQHEQDLLEFLSDYLAG